MANDEVPPRLHGWPVALDKALHDPFDYACGVDGIGTIFFTEAHDRGDGWVLLILNLGPGADNPKTIPPCPDRGLEVRLSDIRWVADAPHGS